MKEIVGIYCRLSEEDKNKKNKGDDSESIQNQKSMLITYAVERGWEIYRIYSDDDYTGADRRRPEFNRMLQDAEDGKINIVLCKSQSRFSRELEIVERYIHGYFLLWGIRFIGVADNADTAVRGNKKARQINGLVNEWYLEDLSDSIKSVFDDRRSKGLHIGADVAYGYKKDPENKGHIVVDPHAAGIVREIFELFASGMGKNAIIRRLNERGEPNPAEYKRVNGLFARSSPGKYGTLWGVQTIGRILKNEIYIGNMIQGTSGTVSYKIKKIVRKPREEWFYVPGTHEAIIEKELWNTVQELLKSHSRSRKCGTVNIFSRKARCAYCGYAMYSQTKHKKKYLTCGSRERIPGSCTGSFIPQRVLEEAVLEELHTMIAQYLDVEKTERMICIPSDYTVRIREIEKDVAALTVQMNRSKNALQEAFVEKANGGITTAEFEDMAGAFRTTIESCEQKIAYRKKEMEVLHERNEQETSKKEILQKYCNINELTYDIINTFIHYIEIGKRKSKSEDYPIKIYWNF